MLERLLPKSQSRVFSVFFATAVALSAALAGCGGDLGDCPSNSATQQAAGKAVLTSRCSGCHSPSNAGGNPAEGLDVTVDSVVKSEASDLYGEASEGAMPPSGRLSDADLESLRVYLACTQ